MQNDKAKIFGKVCFLLILLLAIAIPNVSSAEYGKIDNCFATPLCIDSSKSSGKPTLIEPATEETKETYDGVKENTSASWVINATGGRRFVNVTVLGQVPSNPNVQDVRGDEHRKEIQFKGIIPETDTLGHPFFMANYSANTTFKNPQVLPANSNEFHGKETFDFDSRVNVSDTEPNTNWTTFMFANSTNPFVDEKESDRGTVQVLNGTQQAAPNPCAYPGLNTNFEINLSDYCVINSTYDLGTGNITFVNKGNVTFNATLKANEIGGLPANQRGYMGKNATVEIGK